MARARGTAALAGTFLALQLPAGASDFDRDVRPILQAHCVSCHGAERQESLLRLDSPGQVRKGGQSGEVVVPGRSASSLLIQHLTGQAKPRMPHEKPALDPSLVGRIAAWIDAGAKGSDDPLATAAPVPHWAYRKPRRPPLPAVRDAAWVRSPIDAFVLARLEQEGLAASPEASRETLVRRLSLDLVGLPPSPSELDAFLSDPGPGAYAALVERLLASPRYGERWARPWLDLARYADTNGYEKDQRRTAWKYRDWVIGALNRDLSFRDFTIEQLAGDMLQDASVPQRIATGFHRNTQLNQEGGIDVEEQRFETLVDRVGTTGTVWLGSTIACAQCHNHKFDPVSQKDYYRLLAFFDNGEYRVHGQGEEVVDRWIVEPELELATPEVARRRDALRREAEALRLEIETRELDAEIAAFEREISGPAPVFTPLAPVRFAAKSGARAETLADGSLRVAGKPEDKDSYTVGVRTTLAGITAFRLEALPDASLPQHGPGRSSSGAFVVTSLSLRAGSRPVPLVRAGADVNEKGRAAALLVDGHAATGWGVTAEMEAGRAHFVVVAPQRPLPAAGPGTLTVTLEFQSGHGQASLGRFRLSATTAPRPFAGLPVPEDVRRLLGTPAAERTAEQTQALRAWFRPLAPSLDAARDRARAIEVELDEMRVVTALVMQERAGYERPSTPLRIKGSFTNPGERVYAAVPAVFGALSDELPPNRLGLARWLVSDDNPLTARVDGEPAVGDALRPRPGRDGRGLRDAGRAAEPPRAARLAGRRVHGARLEPEGDPARDRELGHLPAGLLRERLPARAGSGQPAAGPRRSLQNRGRDGARRGARRRGAAEPEARRAERLPATARGRLERALQPDEVGDEHGRGPLPPEPLHLLQAELALPEPRLVRRAEPRAVHGAARAHQHAAAGAHDAQRPGVRGGGARSRAADGDGGRIGRARPDRARLSAVHGRASLARRPRGARGAPRSRGGPRIDRRRFG